MKKLLILIFALVTILGFGQNIDWSDYWSKELKKPVVESIQGVEPTFDVIVLADEKTLTIKIIINKADYVFTKYENIFYSSVIYEGFSNYYKLNARNKIKDWKILYIITSPYERKIFIKDFDKLLLSNTGKNLKSNNQLFINNTILINTEELNAQQKKK